MNVAMSFIIGMVSGILSGIFASIIAQSIIHFFKPNITISEKISNENVDGKNQFRFKIVNNSKQYIKNLSVSAQLITKENAQDGTLITTKPLKLARNDVKFIAPYSKKDEMNLYAVRFRIDDDLLELWNNDQFTSLEVTVYCEKESNSSGKVFKKIYYKRNSIVQGTFETGKSTKIV